MFQTIKDILHDALCVHVPEVVREGFELQQGRVLDAVGFAFETYAAHLVRLVQWALVKIAATGKWSEAPAGMTCAAAQSKAGE